MELPQRLALLDVALAAGQVRGPAGVHKVYLEPRLPADTSWRAIQ